MIFGIDVVLPNQAVYVEVSQRSTTNNVGYTTRFNFRIACWNGITAEINPYTAIRGQSLVQGAASKVSVHGSIQENASDCTED